MGFGAGSACREARTMHASSRSQESATGREQASDFIAALQASRKARSAMAR